MSQPKTLIRCDDAMQFIERVEDPITKTFLNMAFVHFVKTTHLEQHAVPSCDFDMLYFVTILRDFFSEHQVLAQTLSGEKVGAWFEEG